MAKLPIPASPDLSSIPEISARDSDLSGIFPKGFETLYEVHSYRNAARILAESCTTEFQEIISTLMKFRIPTADVVVGGGNKSKIALGMEKKLKPLGWLETRIVGDLLIRRISRVAAPLGAKKGPSTVEQVDQYRIPGFVDGHKVDFIKGQVAFDMEWNSKDQTFDRDLYAIRAFYDCNIVTAGVLLTRSADLVPVFEQIGARVDIASFKRKFGASTTWMKKLTYRLDAGRAGGCPILALGIRPSVISDFEAWKKANPEKRAAPALNIEEAVSDDDTDTE